MKEQFEIILSHDKSNIINSVSEIKGEMTNLPLFLHLVEELKTKRASIPRVLIYCKNKPDCATLYRFFQRIMATEFTEPPGALPRIPECRLVDMFIKGTETEVKDCIIRHFTRPSPLRIVITTVAFGMGGGKSCYSCWFTKGCGKLCTRSRQRKRWDTILCTSSWKEMEQGMF